MFFVLAANNAKIMLLPNKGVLQYMIKNTIKKNEITSVSMLFISNMFVDGLMRSTNT